MSCNCPAPFVQNFITQKGRGNGRTAANPQSCRFFFYLITASAREKRCELLSTDFVIYLLYVTPYSFILSLARKNSKYDTVK